MKRGQFLVVGAIALGFLGLSVPSASRAEGGKREFPPPKMVKELQLTEDQVVKMKVLQRDHRSKMQSKRTKVKEAHEELRKAMQSDASESDLRAKFEAVQNARKGVAAVHFEHVLEVRKILTPDQRKKFRGMASKFHKRGKRRGRGGRGMGGGEMWGGPPPNDGPPPDGE